MDLESSLYRLRKETRPVDLYQGRRRRFTLRTNKKRKTKITPQYTDKSQTKEIKKASFNEAFLVFQRPSLWSQPYYLILIVVIIIVFLRRKIFPPPFSVLHIVRTVLHIKGIYVVIHFTPCLAECIHELVIRML